MDPKTKRDVIPPPFIVRERLAASLREARLLRRLLRLSVTAALEKERQTTPDLRQTAAGQEAVDAS
jgi:hypothetical protein